MEESPPSPASPSPPPKRLAVQFDGREVYVTPGRSRSSSLGKFVHAHPTHANMCPVVPGEHRGPFADDDKPMTSSLSLEHSLDAVPAEVQLGVKKLVVTMKSTVEGLVDTCLMRPAAALHSPDDDSELAAQVLFNKFADAVSRMVNAMDRGGSGQSRGFHISAARGGVVLVGDTITLASVFIGPSLPTKTIFNQMVRPGSRSLQDAPDDQQSSLKRLCWYDGGGQELSAKKPAKVHVHGQLLCSRPDGARQHVLSTQVFEKINARIDVMLPGASSDKFVFETIPFKAILGLGEDGDQSELGPGDDGGDDGMNADGTYTVRDKDHANRLMRDGCYGHEYINRRMVLAAVMWFKENNAAGYNYGSISKMCKTAESKIATADKALTYRHKALETFESVPGVHHLVNLVTESIDLENEQKCFPVFIYGQ